MPDEPEWYARTLKEVALFFRVKVKTVDSWRQAGWMPKRSPKGYDLAEISHLRYERLSSRPQASRENTTRSLRERKLQIENENWRKKKLENDLRAGELLPKEQVQAELSRWAARFPGPLLSLANELANRVPGNRKAKDMKWAVERIEAALAQVNQLAVAGIKVEDAVLEHAKRIRAERRKRKQALGK